MPKHLCAIKCTNISRYKIDGHTYLACAYDTCGHAATKDKNDKFAQYLDPNEDNGNGKHILPVSIFSTEFLHHGKKRLMHCSILFNKRRGKLIKQIAIELVAKA